MSLAETYPISTDALNFAEIMAEQELAGIVREACRDSGLTREEIAERLRIKKSALSHLLNSGHNMTAGTAGRVLRALNRRIGFRSESESVAPAQTSLLIQMEVPPSGNVALHFTTPHGMAVADVLPLFEKAVAALQAEITEAAKCPAHKTTA